MSELMKKVDFINDIKFLLGSGATYLISHKLDGLIGLLGALVAFCYGLYRFYKLYIDIETSKIERNIKKIELKNLKKTYID